MTTSYFSVLLNQKLNREFEEKKIPNNIFIGKIILQMF